MSYLALTLAGDSPYAYHLAAAAGWIRDAGGIDAVGVTARAWPALFGVTGWATVPVPVPEGLWFPARGAQTSSRVVAVTLAVVRQLARWCWRRCWQPAVAQLSASTSPRSERPSLPGDLAVGIQGPPGNDPDHQYRPRR